MISAAQLDWVFLSYDEPNSEENWQRVLAVNPRCQRVHGVRGSDRAHKACAELSATDRVLIIDGDNWIDPALSDWQHDFPDDFNIDDSVLSFKAQNSVNHLEYGNGGIKIWPRAVVLTMQTHELAQDDLGGAALDFCWTVNYVLMPARLSETRVNSTRQQAWRAGYREGVKMALCGGQWQPDPCQWHSDIAEINLRRLETWLMVGADVANGLWAILGARQGLHSTMIDGKDPKSVHDFDNLASIWDCVSAEISDPRPQILELGSRLKDHLGIAVEAEPMSAGQSRWFKHWLGYRPPSEPRRLKV